MKKKLLKTFLFISACTILILTVLPIFLDKKKIITAINNKIKNELNLNIDNRNREEALSALEVLGFSSKNVHNLIDSLLDKNPSIKLEDLVKEALKQL